MSACSRDVEEVGSLVGLVVVEHVAEVDDGEQVEERRGLDRLHPERAQRDLEWSSQGDREAPAKMLRSGKSIDLCFFCC